MKYKLYKESKTGLFCREGTLDEYVVKEQSSYSPVFPYLEGAKVMDIGANIGAFTNQALKNGATRVLSVEPDPDNIKMFEMQDFSSVKLIKGAVASFDGTAELYINSGKNKGMHSLQEISGRDCVEVKTVSFERILNKYKPRVLKIDIEGGEYGLNMSNIPSFVEAIAIEIHLNHADNRSKAARLIKQLKRQFPEVLKEPHITQKNWTTLFIGARRLK